MSCSLTIDAVRARTKTVTRRHVDTWRTLKPGDRLTLIEKGMGLPKGARQVVLAEVEIVSVCLSPLASIVRPGELEREGLPDMTDVEFVDMWARSHGYGAVTDGLSRLALPTRRIEWRYVDEAAT
jgi:hypothetical protein